MSITAILTDPAKGGTFLTWTLHYLAGHSEYYLAREDRWLGLTNNPVTGTNAHKFAPNQPGQYKTLCVYLDRLSACPTKNFHTLYMHNFPEYPYSEEHKQTKKGIDKLLPHVKKVIVLTNQPKNMLYEKSWHSRIPNKQSLFDPNIINVGDQDQFEDFLKFFFADSLEAWQKLQLNEVWDRREFLALNYRHHAITITSCMDLSIDHFDIDCLEWFANANSLIENLFDYLEIALDRDRLSKWNNIYNTWRLIHQQRLNFLWSFDKIVNYIVQGHYMDLTRFNLDIYQEAIIQHALIYKHNLNLKTFKLEKFKDTIQLHHLLEPNIHNIKTVTDSV